MRNKNCEIIRRELDELMLDGTFSTTAAEHLNECSDCREFNRTQTKLRRMVGSLGTVEAPPDFDFRLRARLASDPATSAFNYWPLVQRGLAVAAAVIVVAFGVLVIKNLDFSQQKEVRAENPPAAPQQSPGQVEPVQPNSTLNPQSLTAHNPLSGVDKNKGERPQQVSTRIKRPMTAVDFSKQRAEVYPLAEAYNSESSTVFPIDASLQPLRLSLDDGRGNARTISVPTIRFGSQRMLPNKNQLAEKGIW